MYICLNRHFKDAYLGSLISVFVSAMSEAINYLSLNSHIILKVCEIRSFEISLRTDKLALNQHLSFGCREELPRQDTPCVYSHYILHLKTLIKQWPVKKALRIQQACTQICLPKPTVIISINREFDLLFHCIFLSGYCTNIMFRSTVEATNIFALLQIFMVVFSWTQKG